MCDSIIIQFKKEPIILLLQYDSLSYTANTASASMFNNLSTGNIIAIMAIVVPIIITIVGGIILLIYRSGTITKHIEHLDKDVKDIKEDVKDIKKEIKIIPVLSDRIENILTGRIKLQVADGKSPLRLNKVGIRILKQSKISDIIEERRHEIINKMREKSPNNIYQAQEYLFEIVKDLKNDISI